MAIAISLGKKGTGKSTLLRLLAWACLQDPRRAASEAAPLFFFHDPHHTVREIPGTSRRWRSVAECRAHIAAGGGLPPVNLFDGEDIEGICQLAVAIKDVTVVLDEFDRATDGKKWLSPTAKRIVHEGRHIRVGLWGTFRRTASVSEDLLTQADWVFLFRHSEFGTYDLRGLEQRLGADIVRTIQSLEVGQFVAWKDE